MFTIKSQVILPLTASQLACNYSDSEAISQRNSCSKSQHPGSESIPSACILCVSVVRHRYLPTGHVKKLFFSAPHIFKLLSNARLHIYPPAKCQLWNFISNLSKRQMLLPSLTLFFSDINSDQYVCFLSWPPVIWYWLKQGKRRRQTDRRTFFLPQLGRKVVH